MEVMCCGRETAERTRDTNAAVFCGRLMSRYEKGNVVITTVSVLEMLKGKKVIHYPKIYFFEEDKTGINDFMVGDEVYIQAHIASPRKIRRDGRPYVSYALIGDSIRKRESVLPGDGSFKPSMEPQVNLLYAQGPVLDIIQYPGRHIGLVLETHDHNRVGSVELMTSKKDVLLIPRRSVVTAYGKAVTRVKPDKNGRIRHYQDYVLLSWKNNSEKQAGAAPQGGAQNET